MHIAGASRLEHPLIDNPPPLTPEQRRLFWELEDLGRIRLSRSFHLRDFLHSEIAVVSGIVNRPVELELAVETGRRLCETLLEPLQATFGPIAIRSGYRSPELNAWGHANGLKCARNAYTYADHIWDVRDAIDRAGACACIVIPWFEQRHGPAGWERLAWWLYDHLQFDRVVFFSRQTAFNIGWRDEPRRLISSYLEPKGVLVGPERPPLPTSQARQALYADFPPFGGVRTPLDD